ncbi:IclR family transcriptional regulator [Bradyrhizobium sp. LHD-71]|uniref:IclR family transcriptional regulator n=1 Tax=Bradyrhizobium sp. LHD-71 TaxID=3072141 RepID=UPI00280F4571|nr:IclR family transcriptional regulator [Bradyrhizobium sp. LHD-71]MDQ8731857.1 IclR family transcriptional regulator [Bradyrhizobium sp. LHD-71]
MTVRTADRTLDIFESFAHRQKPVTVSELARELSLPMSTCFALVRTLVDRGYLYYLQPRGAFYPTRRLSRVADEIVAHDPIAQYLQPLLKALRDKTGEAVILGKLQGTGVIYLELIESVHPIRYTMHVGSIREIHASSIGKAILSAMDDGPRDQLLSRMRFPKLTEHTLRTRAQLLRSVEDGRKRGYWMNVSESSPDVTGIAQPVHILGDLYGIALIGPGFRFEKNMTRFVEALTKTARKIADVCARLERS